jgi:hypothetical protein
MRLGTLVGLGPSFALILVACAEGSVAPVDEQPLTPAQIAPPAQPAGSLCAELAPAVRKCGGKLTLGDCEDAMDRYKDAVLDAVRACAKRPCAQMRACLDDAVGETFEIPAGDAGAAPRTDAGSRGDTGSPPLACRPSLPSFTPSAYRGPRRQVGACTAQMAQDLEDCMMGNATKCQLFQTDPQYQACETCAISDQSDPAWGPIVVDPRGYATPNTAGCLGLALGEGATASGCGAAMRAMEECSEKACATCPLSNPPTMAEWNAYDACMASAGSGVCGPYAGTASARCVFDGGSPPSGCTGGSAADLILAFCGP